MKIRIQGNSIRLRLSQSEVATFHESGSVSDSIAFGGSVLTYALERSEAPEMSAIFENGSIKVYVPSEMSDNWATMEQEIGLEHLQRFPSNEGTLRILVEKDFKCLADRPGEDESDNFPNPNLSC